MGWIRKSAALLAVACVLQRPAAAEPLKIGVLTDLSSIYADASGQGGIEAAKMAVADLQPKLGNWTVTVQSADHLGKADVGSEIARRWLDEDGVDAIAGLPNSSVALAVQEVARQKHKLLMITGAATVDLTGKACSPYTAHWTDDTFSLSSGAMRGLLEAGRKTFFLIVADYAYGQSVQAEATRVIEAEGGRVVGVVRHPVGTTDMSAYVVQALNSKAEVIVLANGGSDTVNAIKQAHEFGVIKSGQTMVATGLFITDVHSLGLETAQGLALSTGFYWDRNEATRAWSRRFFHAVGRMPTREQAETYSAVAHYLKGVAGTNSKDAATVIAWMKKTSVDDFYAPGGTLREDGRLLHPIYLARVKAPAESKYPWDYYQLTGTLRADKAFRPLSEGKCAFVQAQ